MFLLTIGDSSSVVAAAAGGGAKYWRKMDLDCFLCRLAQSEGGLCDAVGVPRGTFFVVFRGAPRFYAVFQELNLFSPQIEKEPLGAPCSPSAAA